jgi:hypothetical protein
MRFENGGLRIEIDEQTGAIVAIADTASGRIHFDAGPDTARLGRLFRVLMPVERWSSHAADSWRSGPPEIETGEGRLVLRWGELRSSLGATGVAAEVELTRGGPSEVLLRLRLTSRRGVGDVTDVLFPWLGGWQTDRPDADTAVLGGARAVAASHFPVNRGITFSRWHQRKYYTYPIDLYAPWVDLSGPEGGVGVLSYQRSARNVGAFLENLAGYERGVQLSIGLNHYLQLRAGQSWESPPIGISVHDGDWHASADRYSAWVDTWFRPPPTPEWARRSIGFQNVLFRGFDGTPIRPLEAIPEVAAAGVRAGMPHLCVWDYVLLGDYAKLDDVPHFGFTEADRATLQAGLADARALGARVSSLQNYRLVKPTSRLFHELGEAEVCRRYNGTPFVEEYSGSLSHAMVITTHVGPMVHPVDARVASVRERVLGLIGQTLDLGFDSHFYDQPFENWPSYNPGRGEDGPDGAHPGTVSLLKEVRAALAAKSPDGILIGEYCDVFGSEAIDLWMSWYTEIDDLRRSVYSIPQTLQCWVVDNDVAAATRAFVVGAQLCLTTAGGERHLGDVPAFAEHVSRLSALRAASPRVWGGRYRDGAGFELEADGPVMAGAFASPTGATVVLGSPGEAGRARLRIDPEILPRSPEGGRLVRLDGSIEAVGVEPASRKSLDIDLAANEVAVLEL